MPIIVSDLLFSNQMNQFVICILTHPFGDGLGEREEGHGDEQVGRPVRRSRQGLAQAPEIKVASWPSLQVTILVSKNLQLT